MTQIIKWLLKAAAAGVIALLLLCAWCSFYYNVPIHFANDTDATEYRWESSKFYRRGTEGFAFNRTNNDGFNNVSDYTPGEPVDILLMGSSHMEAFNVPADKSAAAELNRLFAGEKYVYNIGTSGHTLLYCIKHLDSALSVYRPNEYVVLELGNLDFSDEQISQTLAGELPDIPSHNGGIVGLMQRLCYLRLFYTKYVKGTNDGDVADIAADSSVSDSDKAAQYNALMDMVAEVCARHSVRALVVAHNFVLVDDSGHGYTDTDESRLAAFQAACENNGISFLNLDQRFLSSYEEYHRLPYGFSNTAPGAGHLNQWGQTLFAGAVYGTISGLE